MPTEAQWEFACRAGTETAYSFGNRAEDLVDYGWFDGNSASRTHAVGERKPNPWGFYDLHGNVYEWCRDWYDEEFYTTPEAATDPSGRASGVLRVYRGGTWYIGARNCRSANRSGDAPDYCFNYLGFRLAAVPVLSSSSPEASPPGTDSGR